MLTVITPTIRPELLHITEETLKNQTFRDFEWLVEIGDGKEFQLPADYNKLLRRAKGDIIVSLQDCIRIAPDFLEKVSKLDHSKAYTFPVIKDGKNPDWRKYMNGRIQPHQWEIDLACAPMKLFKDVGGFDEAYCGGWSYDNVEIGLRADSLGWRFECNSELEGHAYDHDEHMEHPFRHTAISNAFKLEYTKEIISEGNQRLNHLL